jgi:phage-related protein
MSLDTFNPPIPPSPGTERGQTVAILKAEFGDGYTGRIPDGLNHIRRTLQLKWELLTPAHAKAITDFMLAHKGTTPFLYTPSDEDTPVQWTCEEWDDTGADSGFRSVTAKLEQDFSLVA